MLAVALSIFLVNCNNSGGAAANNGGAAKAPGNSAAQDFVTRDVNGKTVRLGDYLGKKAILINFWSTFCEPCLAEFPHIRRIQDKNQQKGLVVLAVSMDGPETIAAVPGFVKRNGLTFPVLLDEDSHIASLYNPKKSAPLSVLINKDGKITSIREGYNPGDEVELEREVDELVK
jgi:peroxiredoxin